MNNGSWRSMLSVVCLGASMVVATGCGAGGEPGSEGPTAKCEGKCDWFGWTSLKEFEDCEWNFECDSTLGLVCAPQYGNGPQASTRFGGHCVTRAGQDLGSPCDNTSDCADGLRCGDFRADGAGDCQAKVRECDYDTFKDRCEGDTMVWCNSGTIIRLACTDGQQCMTDKASAPDEVDVILCQ